MAKLLCDIYKTREFIYKIREFIYKLFENIHFPDKLEIS